MKAFNEYDLPRHLPLNKASSIYLLIIQEKDQKLLKTDICPKDQDHQFTGQGITTEDSL